MNTEITKLIHLLNKGVEQLPQTLTMLIKDYQHQQITYAVISGIFLIAVIVIVGLTIRPFWKWVENSDGYDMRGFGFGMYAIGAVIIISILFGITSTSVAHAVSPTISLIQSLK